MKLVNWHKGLIKHVLVIALLVGLLGTVSGCEGFGQFPTATTPQPAAEKASAPATISTKDRAILAVYEYLLDEAKSSDAKLYLADFYTTCDNWSAESEYFKDGSGIWYVEVDMSAVKDWKWKPYWQEASWFVFRDGSVVPSQRLEANALRIEADLQVLSPPLEEPKS